MIIFFILIFFYKKRFGGSVMQNRLQSAKFSRPYINDFFFFFFFFFFLKIDFDVNEMLNTAYREK